MHFNNDHCLLRPLFRPADKYVSRDSAIFFAVWKKWFWFTRTIRCLWTVLSSAENLDDLNKKIKWTLTQLRTKFISLGLKRVNKMFRTTWNKSYKKVTVDAPEHTTHCLHQFSRQKWNGIFTTLARCSITSSNRSLVERKWDQLYHSQKHSLWTLYLLFLVKKW